MSTTLPSSLTNGIRASAVDLLHLLATASPLNFPPLAAPIPTVKAHSLAPGSTVYAYSVGAVAGSLVTFGASSTTSQTIPVSNGASLSDAVFNQINWGPVVDAVGYAVYRDTGGPGQGLIALVPTGALLECNPPGALVRATFPLNPPFELHDTGLPVISFP